MMSEERVKETEISLRELSTAITGIGRLCSIPFKSTKLRYGLSKMFGQIETLLKSLEKVRGELRNEYFEIDSSTGQVKMEELENGGQAPVFKDGCNVEDFNKTSDELLDEIETLRIYRVKLSEIEEYENAAIPRSEKEDYKGPEPIILNPDDLHRLDKFLIHDIGE